MKDEYIKKMIGYLRGFPDDEYAEMSVRDVRLCLVELRALRWQKKKLIEMARKAIEEWSDYVGMITENEDE